ncbi:hypothetical protein AVEN_258207-1 [Araneus ventricosus]|uniref:Uncharacterized protein n=1 Tax=Araneus ventricosus TaxID=182803 RepID=A0A4Y2NPZ0_ARAVE|nr:hypothetical protein AVEN_258207-1 [Araneus ventricosus]
MVARRAAWQPRLAVMKENYPPEAAFKCLNQFKALVPWCVACQTSSRSRFVLVDCGRWNSDQTRHSYGAWLDKSVCGARVNGCSDAVCPPPPLTCEPFTAIMRETTDALTSPRARKICNFSAYVGSN